jgi:hypothetical protein
MGQKNRCGKLGDVSRQCLILVQQALEQALLAQQQRVSPEFNDFDRMAINAAREHLERALAELRCFEPSKKKRPACSS